MTENDSEFFKTFGQRIAKLRKSRDLTQSELGYLLSLDQTAVASYEVGRRRVPLSLLAPISKALRVSMIELLGDEAPSGKPGPTPKLIRQIEMVSELPKAKQKFVSDMLETVLQSAT
jgi:transcriptional regulator with XRE-family HTH domain